MFSRSDNFLPLDPLQSFGAPAVDFALLNKAEGKSHGPATFQAFRENLPFANLELVGLHSSARCHLNVYKKLVGFLVPLFLHN